MVKAKAATFGEMNYPCDRTYLAEPAAGSSSQARGKSFQLCTEYITLFGNMLSPFYYRL